MPNEDLPSIQEALWRWHDLVVGMLHLWGPLGVDSVMATSEDLVMAMSLEMSEGDISQRRVRQGDDRWCLVSPCPRPLTRGPAVGRMVTAWVDDLATLHRAACRIEGLALELFESDDVEGAWWLGIAGSIAQALDEYTPMSEEQRRALDAEADEVAALIGPVLVEVYDEQYDEQQLELWEHVVFPHAPDPLAVGVLVDADEVSSVPPGVVVVPLPSLAATAARGSAVPLAVLAISYPYSSWLSRYLPCAVCRHERYEGGAPIGEWFIGRDRGRDVWAVLAPRTALPDIGRAVGALISSDIEARICAATSDRLSWGALAAALQWVAL